jgi:tRNA/rRNA methyltransferase
MAGTDRSRHGEAITGGPRVILVEPQLGENIGATARAMLNCGLTELAIVAPREPWPNPRAQAMASGADRVLEAATLYDRVEDAVADLSHVYAASARPRDMVLRTITPRLAADELRARHAAGASCGVLFGPERSGLTNDHIALAGTVITVPLNPSYASLNLGQAVLIVAYEWFQAADATPAEDLPMAHTRPATQAELEGFFGRFEDALDKGGFFRARDLRPTMARNFRNLFQRAQLTEQEVRTLHGAVSSLTGSWRETTNQRRARGELDEAGDAGPADEDE